MIKCPICGQNRVSSTEPEEIFWMQDHYRDIHDWILSFNEMAVVISVDRQVAKIRERENGLVPYKGE